MKVLVVLPRERKLFKAMEEAASVGLGQFYLIGDKNLILETCFKENISSQNFTIFNLVDEIEIIAFSIDLLNKQRVDFVIFGDVPNYFQNKILGLKSENDIGVIDIIDLSFLKHFLCISNNTKRLNADFDDKKKAIILADKLLKQLGVKQTNVSFISNISDKTDMLEHNIIKMILKDNDFSNISVLDSLNIELLFSKNNTVNIFNNRINLLILRNYEASRIFIDTLNTFTNAKVASLLVTDQTYAVDAGPMRDYHNILFSIMILGKLYENLESVCYQKKHVV